MFLFKHTDGIPNHPNDPNIKRAVFVSILSEMTMMDEMSFNTDTIQGYARLNLDVLHYTTDEAGNVLHRHKGLDKNIQLIAENTVDITIPGNGSMPDFDAITYMLTNKLIHMKDLLLYIIIDRFTIQEGETISKIDAKMMY